MKGLFRAGVGDLYHKVLLWLEQKPAATATPCGTGFPALVYRVYIDKVKHHSLLQCRWSRGKTSYEEQQC